MTDRSENAGLSSFVLAVDGAGAFLVVRQPLIEIGPRQSRHRAPAIPLQLEEDHPSIFIERIEEDYFVSGESLLVNEQPTPRRLLIDGDKIALAARCRAVYHRPNAASTTATLSFTGARLPRTDLRRAILMEREILISQAPSAHLRLPGLSEPILLFSRGNGLMLRSGAGIEHAGRGPVRESSLLMNRTVRVGPLCLTISTV